MSLTPQKLSSQLTDNGEKLEDLLDTAIKLSTETNRPQIVDFNSVGSVLKKDRSGPTVPVPVLKVKD